MLPQYGNRQRRRTVCSGGTMFWVLLIVLACVAGGSLYCLQSAYKEVESLRSSLKSTEGQRRSLQEQTEIHKQKVAQAETKVKSLTVERDELKATQKDSSSKLAEAEKEASTIAELNTQLAAAEGKLKASESEIKEITVKAGTCQQQFAALNADCATLKQGLANLGLSSKTVDVGDNNSIKNSGALDPRGGMEAAKVLQNHSQQPWKGEGKKAGEQGSSGALQQGLPGLDSDETGPGLEKGLAQAGAVV